MNIKRMALLLSVGVAVWRTQAVTADSIVLAPSQDATLYESEFGDTSNGAGSYFFAGVTAQNLARRGLVQFDLTPLPSDCVVLGVRLRLHMSRTATSGVVVNLHRVTRGWSEGASVAFGEEGAGVPAEPGDVTWLHTRFDWDAPEFWGTPGGDFVEEPSGTAIVYGNGFYDWTDAGLTADVQAWAQQPDDNFGWEILGEEGLPQTTKRFDSRSNPNESFRPQLLVDFVRIPEPDTFAVYLAGLLVLRRGMR